MAYYSQLNNAIISIANMKQSITLLFLITCYQLIASSDLTPIELANSYYERAGVLYKNDSLKESVRFAYKALAAFTELDDQSMVTKSAFRIYQNHYKSQNYTLALESAQRCIEVSHTEDWKHLSLYNKGLAFLRLAFYDSALASFDDTYQYFLKQGNERWISNAINQKALTYYYVGAHDKAREYYQDLLDLSLDRGNDKFAGNALNNIGNSYLKEGNMDSAHTFLTEALKYQTNDRDKLSTYLNLAKVSSDPVPYLLIAKNLYANELEVNEYVDVLHQLTIHHTDSIQSYTAELAQLAVTNANKYKQVSDISNQLEVKHMETVLELKKEKLARIKNLKIFLLIFVFTVLAAISIIYFFRKRWLPEWAKYQLDLMTYQVKELQKTIRQFKDSQ